MKKNPSIIFLIIINSGLLLALLGGVYMTYEQVKHIEEIQTKISQGSNHPYLSNNTRIEQRQLLQKARQISSTFTQEPSSTLELIHEIEELALDASVPIKIGLNANTQQNKDGVVIVPMEIRGSGTWEGLLQFENTLRNKKPGFFLDSMDIADQANDQLEFKLTYTVVWRGNL